MIDDEDASHFAPLEPCGYCGVERPYSALKQFEGELACFQCRGTTVDDEDSEDAEDAHESEEELDFDEGGEG